MIHSTLLNNDNYGSNIKNSNSDSNNNSRCSSNDDNDSDSDNDNKNDRSSISDTVNWNLYAIPEVDKNFC